MVARSDASDWVIEQADASATVPSLRTGDIGMPERRTFLTDPEDFIDVSRGDPPPHTLKGEALARARLTEATWRLQVEAEGGAKLEKPRRLDDGTALDFAALVKLGETRGVKFLKAMQCNNIAQPLGQGLWEGVALRDVLRTSGHMSNIRRLYYWGFHNNDPKQIFRSSLAINQVLDTPPGELPPFLAYRLNGGPIPLERGGPVRMLIPWAHGFKSVKWLQQIVLTNDYRANDTYALQNNDPESYLKTAAYSDDPEPRAFAAGNPVVIAGTAMVGWPGLQRIEYWLRPDTGTHGKLADDDPAWRTADWRPCGVEPPPADWRGELPADVRPSQIWGFAADGKPKEWPMRFSVAHWTVRLTDLKTGAYELRVRTVDKNGFAQPEPRPGDLHSGRNGIQCKQILIMA